MNDIQNTLLELLVEFDDLCRHRRVTYSLADRLAWDAVKFGGFHDRTYDAVVMVHGAEYESIKQACASQSSRAVIDAKEDDLALTGFYYANTETALIDFNEPLNKRPMAICIQVLRIPSSDTKPTARNDRATLDFADPLTNTEPILFEECEFQITSQYDSYFCSLVGSDWRNRNWPHAIHRKRFGVVSSSHVSPTSLIAKLQERNVAPEHLGEQWLEFAYWRNTHLEPAEAQCYKSKLLLRFEQERYQLAEQYLPAKQILLKRYSNGITPALRIAMKNYADSLVLFFERLHRVLCFDEDLFELALAILENRGYPDDCLAQIRSAKSE